MRRLRVAAALVLALGSLLMGAGSAGAFPLTTCTASVISYAPDGTVIGTATSGANDGTSSNPLEVDPEGLVDWQGSTGSAFHNTTYHVDVYGIPTPLREDSPSPNNSDTSSSTGSVDVGETLPFLITGLYHVTGEYRGDGASCVGSIWIKLRGDPVGSVGFAAGIALALVGLAAIAASVRGRHPVRGFVGGLFAGLGAALLAITFGQAPLGDITPLSILLVIVAAATALGIWDFGSSKLKKAAQEKASQCDELLARLRLMKTSRTNRMGGIEQGVRQLTAALRAEQQAAADRERLSLEHVQAVGLLAAAGTIAWAAVVSAIGSAGAAARLAGQKVLEAQGGAGVELGAQAGAQIAQHYATASAAASQASTAGVATGAAAGGVVAAIEHSMSSALTELDGAMAKAVALREQLETSIRESERELSRLDSEIGDVLKQLETCPNVPPSEKADFRTPPPPMPGAAGVPVRG